LSQKTLSDDLNEFLDPACRFPDWDQAFQRLADRNLAILAWSTIVRRQGPVPASGEWPPGRGDEWAAVLGAIAYRLLVRRNAQFIDATLDVLGAAASRMRQFAEFVRAHRIVGLSNEVYVREMKKLAKEIAPPEQWAAGAIKKAIRRFETMNGTSAEVDVVFTLAAEPATFVAGGVVATYPFFVPAFPARLTIQSGFVKPFDGHELFLSEEFYNNARLIDRHFGSRRGKVSLDLDWLSPLGLDHGRLEGTSGGLAQAVLLDAARRRVTLPASSAYLGRIQDGPDHHPVIKPVRNLRQKLEGLMEAGGYRTVYVAAGQQWTSAPARPERLVVDGELFAGGLQLRVLGTGELEDELARLMGPRAATQSRKRRRPARAAMACQRCGNGIDPLKTHYLVNAEVVSEPRELVLTDEDLRADHSAQIEELIAGLENASAQECEDSVYVKFRFHLCVPCQRAFVLSMRPSA
jgi:hypothetical protein